MKILIFKSKRIVDIQSCSLMSHSTFIVGSGPAGSGT